jgi:hypothetical protein
MKTRCLVLAMIYLIELRLTLPELTATTPNPPLQTKDGPPRRDVPPKVQEILRKAIDSHGGRQNLLRLGHALIESKVADSRDPDNPPQTFSLEEHFDCPSRLRSTVHITIAGQRHQFVSVLNGTKGWARQDGETRKMSRDELQQAQDGLYQVRVIQLLPLLEEPAFVLAPLAEAKIGGRAAVGVSVESKGRDTMRLFFDKHSGLLAKVERRSRGPNAKEHLAEVYFERYKSFSGLQFATKKRIVLDGRPSFKVDVSAIRFPAKVDPGNFAKP